ncbi:carbohydrate ABC transporter permease [Kribbella sp. NPDC004875]|uniref:carbohydrate ABC transporter permease n=1 Tax=Kribbella sp. NPDC004875 TaxID=3364107 RepID=UPI0036A836EF
MAVSSQRSRFSAFGAVNTTILVVIALLCIYPFLYIISVSLSDGRFVAAGHVFGWPKGLNIETYRYVLSTPRLGILRGVLNSAWYTAAGTAFSVVITFLTGYALSKKRLAGAGVILMGFIVTWIFDAGIVPAYIVNQKLGFVDNWLVMVIPWGFSTFLLIVTISFLRTIPDELEESAFVDGANDLQVMWRIYVPLSRPVIATIAIFYAVQIWNSFLVPLIYFRDRSLAPIQLVLYNLLIAGDADSASFQQIQSHGHQIYPVNIQAATMVFAIVPILCFYPWAQRYFSKGILTGAVKG